MGNNVHHGHHHGDHISGAARSANADEEVKNPDKPFTDPVSYTHLTLPTKA